MSLYTIYCLECEEGKYYVGQTPKGRLQQRFDEHMYYSGSKWTTRYKPKKIMWKFDVPCTRADEEEERAVFELMMQYGRNSVRGGTFNIANDVTRKGPKWLKGLYKQHWHDIIAAGGD